MRTGVKNLSTILPDEESLPRLLIYTDGNDMIVAEKGNYFSAITRQRYLCFDTELICKELVILQQHSADSTESAEIDSGSTSRLHCR